MSLPTAIVAATTVPRIETELAELNGDLHAFWNRHREDGKSFAEWRGLSAFAFAPTGPDVADFLQLSLAASSRS